MFKLTTVETYRAETKEEAEQFIKEEREKGVQNGYDVSQAAYKHYDKRQKMKLSIRAKSSPSLRFSPTSGTYDYLHLLYLRAM